ncbi:acyl-CoA dehydrogenase family protein [Nocardia brasiliensis]|uniref:acyl-CoA dehydrogenase family protein n=1 Tax=Nocardia brasiliensis TaxID=37326 RepID=UPI001893657D|nr:acyl-CoA dehydrogenase family protein [Nocardia brasiliensis]MBF6548327.1 acyl-CoA/acyl-ACP dehydrogenase [Nocardia brasiliensis]
MMAEKSWIERAAQVADEVLAPQAQTVDQDGEIPRAHFDRLAEAGFYGVALQDDLDPATFTEAAEILIAGCLATAFVWAQHHGVARRVSVSPNHELRERLTPDLRDGRIRAGVSYAGAAEPPSLVARRTAGGYLLEGTAPFVSGWGMVDLVGVMARDSADEGALVSVVVPAVEGPQLRVRQIPLVAANASRTVTATFDELFVPDADVDTLVPLQKFHDSAAIAVWRNGSLPLGLVRRCVAELETLGADQEALREAAVLIRKELDAGLFGQTDLFVARARASELALRAAAALMTATGSRGIVTGSTAERTLREATFTLVFGSRPPIKTALFDHLTGTAGQP